MHDFPRLPSLLRVVRLLGLLCLLASSVLFWELFFRFLRSLSADSWRVLMIALNLLVLSGACFTAVRAYRARFRQPEGEPFPLGSWQSQVRAVLLVTAVLLCALALAVFIPPTSAAFGLVFPASMIAFVVLAVTHIVGMESSGPMRTPRA